MFSAKGGAKPCASLLGSPNYSVDYVQGAAVHTTSTVKAEIFKIPCECARPFARHDLWHGHIYRRSSHLSGLISTAGPASLMPGFTSTHILLFRHALLASSAEGSHFLHGLQHHLAVALPQGHWSGDRWCRYDTLFSIDRPERSGFHALEPQLRAVEIAGKWHRLTISSSTENSAFMLTRHTWVRQLPAQV